MNVAYSKRALGQAKRLRKYIATRSGEERADLYLKRVLDFCERLPLAPMRGQDYGHIRRGLRAVGFERRVLIVFRVKPDSIVIDGIYYGGQEWPHR